MFARSAWFWLPATIWLSLLPPAPAAADWAAVDAALAARDYATAEAELRPLAEAGDALAKYQLAELFLDGHGGSGDEAILLLTASAEAGEPQAQARLGVIYAKGEAGQPKNDVQAFKWLTLAARGAKPGVSRILANTNKSVVARRLSEAERQQALGETQLASANAAQAPAPDPVPTQAVETSAIAAPTPGPESPSPESPGPESTSPEQPVEASAAAIEEEAESPAPASLETAAASPATDALGKSIRIQLAAVGEEQAIQGEWKRLQRKLGSIVAGLEMHVEIADLGTKGTFYRIQAGPFADRGTAKRACKSIRAAKSGCLVILP